MIPSICYEYPLRPDYTAQLILPRELTAMEAARLVHFIKTLVIEPGTALSGAPGLGQDVIPGSTAQRSSE